MTIKSAEGPLSYYIFAAERPLEVIAKYNLLTGYMPLPPVWALGYHQCRWSYHPASRVKEIMEQFRKREIPCDSVWMDIDYMDGFRCFTFDKKKGFDPKDIVEYGRERGIRPIVILDPGIKVDESYSVYNQLIEGDHALKLVLNDEAKEPYVGKVWPGDCVFPDFTSQKTRDWWGQLYKEMIDAGIEGYWNDMNEPAIFNETMTMPENVKSSVGMHSFFHNLYGAMMARATYEGIKKLKPDTRPFVLTRSGFSGVQKFAWSWTGDNYSTWEHLRLSIPMCLSMCLSGMSGIGVDIGGFEKDCTPELFTRWIQVGTFFPFMRVHSAKTTKDQEPWSFGEEVEIISKRFIQLRYRLIPYIYTWLRHCSQTGEPLMRALFLEFPNDPACYEARWEESQFFLGPSLMVAPQLHELQMSREVYFPPAPEGWFNFFTKEQVTPTGGVVVTVPTPLDTLPLFVRGNTVIPIKYKARRNVEDTLAKEPYEFLSFGKDLNKCQGLLYEDDGLSWAHQQPTGFKLHQLNQFGIVPDS
jgi:alpha-glucosidase